MAWRRRWLILLPLALGAAGTAAYTRTLPSVFKSETLILIVPQQVPRTYVASTVTVQIDQRLAAIAQQVLSRSQLERLIEEFDLYPGLRQRALMEDVVARMKLDITTEFSRSRDAQAGTSFRLGYTSSEPRTAMLVTERLATMFIDANLRDRELLAQGTDQFIEAELNAARTRLEEKEKAIEEYRRRHPWDQAEEVENNRWHLVNSQQALANVQGQVAQGRDRLLFLEKMVADLTSASEVVAANQAPAAAGKDAPVTAAARLQAAKAALVSLQMRLKPEHPDVIAAKRTIADLEEKAEQEALAAPLSPNGGSVGPIPPQHRERLLNIRDEMDVLKRRIAQSEAEEAKILALIAEKQRRIENYPLRVREMAALTRDYDTIKSRYHDLLNKRESARLSVNLERAQGGEQMKIIEPARLPQRPLPNNRGRINLMGAAIGLVLGLLLAAFLEYRDTTLRTDVDVLAALSLPVIALVPVMRTAAEIRRARRRQLLWSVTGTVTAVVASVAAMFWTFTS